MKKKLIATLLCTAMVVASLAGCGSKEAASSGAAASDDAAVEEAAAEGDSLTIDFEGFVGDEKIEHGEGKNYTLDLANSNFIPGFAEQLVGHNINEEFDIQVTFPAEYHDEKLKGQPATFSIKMKEIKQIQQIIKLSMNITNNWN